MHFYFTAGAAPEGDGMWHEACNIQSASQPLLSLYDIWFYYLQCLT